MSKPQATSLDHREAKLFRGRAAELELARGLWSLPLPAEQRRALLIVGIGGIGKSALARRIVRDLKDEWASDPWLEMAKPAYAAIDLAETWSQDVVQALLQLRLQLGMTWREARFPLFDFAFARIHAERFPSSDVLRQYELLNPDGTVVRRLAPALPDSLANSDRLQDAANGINEILADTPLLGTAYKYLNRVFARGLHGLDQRTEPLLKDVAGTSPGLLDQRLPECLGMDLQNAIRTAEQRRPVTLVIDTIEALHRAGPQQSGIEAFQNDAWLRELVWQAKGVGFILLGRDDVEWPTFEHSPVRDWGAIVETHRLGALGDPEVTAILEAYPVPDEEVAAAIREGAEGLPFYLGLQLDIFRDLVAEGLTPIPEHFARAPKAVLARFASHLGERLATAFTTLAHARRFDEALFAHLKDQSGTLIGPVGLAEIARYSLIEGDPDGFFRLHQHSQDLQREELARTRPDDQKRIDEALFAYWDARCQPQTPRSLDAGHDTALREAAHHQRLLAPAEHANWLASRSRPFAEAARLQLCLELWEMALATAERANGSEGAATAVALGNLGVVLRMQGRLDEAREAQERALGIKEKVDGREHHEVAITLTNLGNVLQLLDRLDEARAAQERALGIKEKIYGPAHPEVAITLGNLGNVLQMLGRLEEARVAQERALGISEKIYGPQHPLVAMILGNLGDVLRMQGRLDEARAAQERALGIFEKVYGPAHPEAAGTLDNLGNVLQLLGRLDEAYAAQERALGIFEKVYAPEHHAVARSLGNLGNVLQLLGRLDEAYAAQERALGIFEKVYGPAHHEVAMTLTNLGMVLKQLDDLSGARAVEERALRIFERRLPPTHPSIAQVCENLAITLERLGEAGRAGELRARAAAIREGPDD